MVARIPSLFLTLTLILQPALWAGGSANDYITNPGQSPQPTVPVTINSKSENPNQPVANQPAAIFSQTPFQVRLFDSPEEAVADLLKVEPSDVIVYLKKPSTNGAKFSYQVFKEDGGKIFASYHEQMIVQLPDKTWTFQPKSTSVFLLPSTPPLKDELRAQVAEIEARLTETSFNNINIKNYSLVVNESVPNQREVYKVSYRKAGETKDSSIKVVRKNNSRPAEWFYEVSSDSVSAKSRPLLKKIDEALKSVPRDEMQRMERAPAGLNLAAYAAFWKSLYIANNTVFQFFVKELQALENNPNLPADTQIKIAAYNSDGLAERHLDEASLSERIKEHIAANRAALILPESLDPQKRTIGQLEADLASMRKYRKDLSSYRNKVAQATTIAALQEWAGQFPVKTQPDPPLYFSNSLVTEMWNAEQVLEEAEDRLNPEDPVTFVNRIASSLFTTFDMNGDGSVTARDVRDIRRARDKFSKNPSLSFSDQAREIFGRVGTDFTWQLIQYFANTDPKAQYQILDSIWSARQAFGFNPIVKQSILSFLVDETYKISLKPGNGRLVINIISVAKMEKRPELFPRIREFILQTLTKYFGEDQNLFLKRKSMVLKFWDELGILIDYSRASSPPNLAEHFKYLNRIYSLLTQPVYQKALPSIKKLDMIAFSTLFKGIYGSAGNNNVILSFTAPLRTFIHEIMHMDASIQFGIFAPRGFDVISDEGQPDDFLFIIKPAPSHEEWAEVMTRYIMGSLGLLGDALARALKGRTNLLEKILFMLDAAYPKDPGQITTYTMSAEAQITKGTLPIRRDPATEKISELTFNHRTYKFGWDSTTRRLASVS